AMTIIDPSFRPQPAPAAPVVGWLDIRPAPALSAAVRAALAATGASVRPVTLSSWADAYGAALTLVGAESCAAFGHLLECAQLGADVRNRLRGAREIAAVQVAAAERGRRLFTAELDAALAGPQALARSHVPPGPPPLEWGIR